MASLTGNHTFHDLIISYIQCTTVVAHACISITYMWHMHISVTYMWHMHISVTYMWHAYMWHMHVSVTYMYAYMWHMHVGITCCTVIPPDPSATGNTRHPLGAAVTGSEVAVSVSSKSSPRNASKLAVLGEPEGIRNLMDKNEHE